MSAIAVPATAPRSGWRQLLSFNILTGIVLGIGGWYLGYFIGGHIHGAGVAYYSTEAGQNDIAIMLGYLLGRGRVPGRAWVRQLPAQAAARTSAEPGGEGVGGLRADPLLQPLRPTTRSSPSSTWSGSGCSSSSAG